MSTIRSQTDPTKCRCCGQDVSLVECVCSSFPNWYMNDHGDMACGLESHRLALFQPPEKTTIALGVEGKRQMDPLRNVRDRIVGND